MKLRYLWIDHFKNLRDFRIEFGNDLTTVIIGSNGTGKSNLLEALAIIFRELDLEHSNLPFEYYLVYDCQGHRIEIDANPSLTRPAGMMQLPLIEDNFGKKKRRGRLQIRVDGKDKATKNFFAEKINYLPKHVFGYYSGPTNRLAQHFEPHQRKFYQEQIDGHYSPLRPLFFALPFHSQFVLLAYFSFPDPKDITFLRDYLGITSLESVLFAINRPDWGKVDFPNDLFWGAKGIPRQTLEILYNFALAPIREKITIAPGPGKQLTEERLYLYIKDIETLILAAQKWKANQEFFKALDTLYISRLIAEVRIRVKRVGIEGDITFSELSEGEQQLLTVLGLLKFTRDSESLFLLDEPDTHLNPVWKLEYMRLIEPIVGEHTRCQILLATHDPIVIGSCTKEQVRVLAFEEGNRAKKSYAYQPDKNPRGMGVAALLTSDVYGLRSTLDWETQEKLDTKRRLAAKPIDELTENDKKKLQELNQELKTLDFTFSTRDPLYPQFVAAMTEETERRPELQKEVLTKEELVEQTRIAREIAARLKNQTKEG